MKTSRFLTHLPASLFPSASWALGIASVLLTPLVGHAAPDTWDGGGANDNVSTGANWVDNTAPVSSLANTDLFFGTAPEDSAAVNFSAAFSAHSLTIQDADGFLDFYTFSGQTLSVGSGGISHDGGKSATFTNPVSFSGVANSTISEGFVLLFTNTVTLPTNTLTVNGAGETFFENFSGSGALTKSGAGIMNWTPTVTANVEINVSAGTLRMHADGVTDVLGGGGSIAVNGSSLFDVRDNLTLDGATLTRASGAEVILAADKTLRVQNGGDVVMTDSYSNTTDSTITVTGAGSSFTGDSTLSFNGGSALNVTAGGTVAAGARVNVGTAGDGTVFVAGSGSFFGGANLHVGGAGDAGVVVFNSDSTGMFATINVANSNTAGTSGTLIIQSGAAVTGSALVIANVAGDADGAVTITGAGSTLTLTGTAITSIGAGVQNTGALNVSNGGTFNSGTGLTTVRATGSIVINGGTYNSNGDLTLNGGMLRLLSGTVNADSIELTAGGTVDFDGGVLHVESFTGGLVNQGGTLAPGQSLGITTVTGTYFQQSAGTLQIQIGGLTPGTQYDRLDVSSILGLDGTLNVLLANGFNPQSGDSFDILNWFGLLGNFDAINLPALVAPLAWDTSQLYTTGALSVIGGSSFTADFDNDGDVDSADLNQWQGDFGMNALSDADDDGDSDGADFLAWQQQLGSGAPAASTSAAVPEPGGLILAMLAGGVGVLSRQTVRLACAA
jgi:hypothetical protein